MVHLEARAARGVSQAAAVEGRPRALSTRRRRTRMRLRRRRTRRRRTESLSIIPGGKVETNLIEPQFLPPRGDDGASAATSRSDTPRWSCAARRQTRSTFALAPQMSQSHPRRTRLQKVAHPVTAAEFARIKRLAGNGVFAEGAMSSRRRLDRPKAPRYGLHQSKQAQAADGEHRRGRKVRIPVAHHNGRGARAFRPRPQAPAQALCGRARQHPGAPEIGPTVVEHFRRAWTRVARRGRAASTPSSP